MTFSEKVPNLQTTCPNKKLIFPDIWFGLPRKITIETIFLYNTEMSYSSQQYECDKKIPRKSIVTE